jgi:shikimate dehydrogenase
MKVFCILGDGRIFLSKSPIMHTEVMRRRGIEGVYVPFHVEQAFIGDAVKGIRALGIAGANITVPHKEGVLPHLDKLSEEVESIGAANTIIRRGDQLEGRNTDIGGFADALSQAGFSAKGATVLVFGAGGASKAVIFALRKLGAGKIFISNRRTDRANLIGGALGAEAVPFVPASQIVEAADLVVNTTSVSSPVESPETARLIGSIVLGQCKLVLDINYGREDNFWKKLAKASGVPFMDGFPMLVYQARRSFEYWTGIPVTAEEFFEALQGDS